MEKKLQPWCGFESSMKFLLTLVLLSDLGLAMAEEAIPRAFTESPNQAASNGGETVVVLDDGQVGSTWDNGILAWDQAINYEVCSNDFGAGCPTVSWGWVGSGNRGQVLQGRWSNNNQRAGIFFQTLTPTNLSRFSGGVLEFDIRAVSGAARVEIKVDCEYPCASGDYRFSQAVTGTWQRLSVPVSWLVDSGLDLTRVSTGLVFWPADGHAGVTLEIDRVLWSTESSGESGSGSGGSANDDSSVDPDSFGGEENTSPKAYEGMRLDWFDEFDGTALDSQLWNHDIGGWGWGNNESQYYRPENTTVQSGYLVITAKEESFGGKDYTSSRIKTQGTKSFTYGRVDIRAMLPRGQGIWPALWSLGTNFSEVGWPYSGEIDIMEMIGGAGRESEVHGTVHWNVGGLSAPYSHTYQGGKTRKVSGDFADGFNVFSIIRTEDRIQWLVNDQPYYNFYIDSSASLAPFKNPFFLIFNVAVGGNWPGYPDATTQFPQRMVVDYVRVFEFGSEPEPELDSTAPGRVNQLMSVVDIVRRGSASSAAADTTDENLNQSSTVEIPLRGRMSSIGRTADDENEVSHRQPVPVPAVMSPHLFTIACLLFLVLARRNS